MPGLRLTIAIFALFCYVESNSYYERQRYGMKSLVDTMADEDIASSRAKRAAASPRQDVRLYRLLKKRLAWAGEPDVRPVHRQKQTAATNVSLSFELTEILGLTHAPASRSATLDANGWLKLEWTDPNLPWNPRQFGGLNAVRLPISLLWRPDIVLYNSREAKPEVYKTLAVVTSTGYVIWVPPIKLQTTCYNKNEDLVNQDEWQCKWKFGSWTYSMDHLSLTPPESLATDHFASEGDWALSNVTVVDEQKKYPCCQETYQSVSYKFILSKNRG